MAMDSNKWQMTGSQYPTKGATVLGCWLGNNGSHLMDLILFLGNDPDKDYCWMESGGGYKNPPDYWQYLPDPPRK